MLLRQTSVFLWAVIRDLTQVSGSDTTFCTKISTLTIFSSKQNPWRKTCINTFWAYTATETKMRHLNRPHTGRPYRSLSHVLLLGDESVLCQVEDDYLVIRSWQVKQLRKYVRKVDGLFFVAKFPFVKLFGKTVLFSISDQRTYMPSCSCGLSSAICFCVTFMSVSGIQNLSVDRCWRMVCLCLLAEVGQRWLEEMKYFIPQYIMCTCIRFCHIQTSSNVTSKFVILCNKVEDRGPEYMCSTWLITFLSLAIRTPSQSNSQDFTLSFCQWLLTETIFLLASMWPEERLLLPEPPRGAFVSAPPAIHTQPPVWPCVPRHCGFYSPWRAHTLRIARCCPWCLHPGTSAYVWPSVCGAQSKGPCAGPWPGALP